jgi:hypothetical protein
VALGLRRRRLPEAVPVSGLGAEIRDIARWLSEMREDIDAPLLAVVADAGQGKTHLAAQLTVPGDELPAGVFVQGGGLCVRDSLDNLADRVPGLKADRFEDLLEALNSAGYRAGCRIPLVIDGLNEAERPAQWRGLLDSLAPVLADYPCVVVIVTLRKTLADRALPEGTVRLKLDWQRPQVHEIVKVYFRDYKIDPGDAWLPMRAFSQPLFVRMYCEAANAERRESVGAEALPRSLVGVFELYRERVAERLERDPARMLVEASQIKRRLADLAMRMWTDKVRRVPLEEAKKILDVGVTDWNVWRKRGSCCVRTWSRALGTASAGSCSTASPDT